MATGDSQLKTEDGSPYPIKDIKVPHDNDILCGRGTETHRHVGNAMYRKLVNMNKQTYTSSAKQDKAKIAKGIIAAIRNQQPPGRFLQKEKDTGLYYDIGDKKAISKTSQALREGQPKTRREMAEKKVAMERLPEAPPPVAIGGDLYNINMSNSTRELLSPPDNPSMPPPLTAPVSPYVAEPLPYYSQPPQSHPPEPVYYENRDTYYPLSTSNEPYRTGSIYDTTTTTETSASVQQRRTRVQRHGLTPTKSSRTMGESSAYSVSMKEGTIATFSVRSLRSSMRSSIVSDASLLDLIDDPFMEKKLQPSVAPVKSNEESPSLIGTFIRKPKKNKNKQMPQAPTEAFAGRGMDPNSRVLWDASRETKPLVSDSIQVEDEKAKLHLDYIHDRTMPDLPSVPTKKHEDDMSIDMDSICQKFRTSLTTDDVERKSIIERTIGFDPYHGSILSTGSTTGSMIDVEELGKHLDSIEQDIYDGMSPDDLLAMDVGSIVSGTREQYDSQSKQNTSLRGSGNSNTSTTGQLRMSAGSNGSQYNKRRRSSLLGGSMASANPDWLQFMKKHQTNGANITGVSDSIPSNFSSISGGYAYQPDADPYLD